MSLSMQSWMATYMGREATVLASEMYWSVGLIGQNGEKQILQWPPAELKVVYRSSDDCSWVTHEGSGSVLLIPGRAAEKWLTAWQEEQSRPWHRREKTRHSGRVLLGASAVLAILFAGYFFLAPWLAEKMVSQLSPSTETELGDRLYSVLSGGLIKDSAATVQLQAFVDELGFESPYPIRVQIANDDDINAYAFPGGHIVVNSGLLKELQSYPELAALLAHEFVHVRERHVVKQLFRRWGRSIFLALIFGDMGKTMSIAAEKASELRSLQYSRTKEAEADTEGLKLLQQRQIDDEGFVRLMQHLKKAEGSTRIPEYLSSHPLTDKRLQVLQKSVVADNFNGNPVLEQYFKNIKTYYP